jgi:hypothetical protein
MAAITIPPLLAIALVGQYLTVSQTMGILAAAVIIASVLSGRVKAQ